MNDKKIYFDDLLKKIPNKYELVIVAGKRLRRLLEIANEDTDSTSSPTIDEKVQKVFNEVVDGTLETQIWDKKSR